MNREFQIPQQYINPHTFERGPEVVIGLDRYEIKSRELAFQLAAILFEYATRPVQETASGSVSQSRQGS